MLRYSRVRRLLPALLGLLVAAPLSRLYAQGPPGGLRIIEPGQPPVAIHATIGNIERAHGHGGGGGSSLLSYHGGVGGIGVEKCSGLTSSVPAPRLRDQAPRLARSP